MADPRNERFLTLDKNPQQLFDAWQKAGKIPLEFGSFQEMEAAYNQLLKTGITEKAAREELGATYRNVDGQNLLQKNIASDGSERGLNKRAIRTDLNIGTENHLLNRGGQEALDARKAEILTDWNKLSKLEAQQLGIETGKQFHRGHVVAGLEGGSLGIENMWPEHGARNVAHGSAPRIPMGVIENLQIPRNDTETIYNRQLEAEGLAAPRVSNALMIAADEQMVDLYDNGFKPLNIRGPQKLNADSRGYQRNNEAGRSPESMEATQNRLNQLEAQGVNPQAIENWTREQSATLSRGNAVAESGPVKVVQPAVKKPVNVVPAGSTRAKPQLVSSGSAGSMGSKPVLTIKPPTNSSVAKNAAGVAPTPKPPISQINVPRVNPRALAIGAAIPGAAGAVFDGAALASGAQQMRSNDPRAKLAGALDAVSGATGLAALAPTPATPALGTISAAAGLASQAVTHKVDQKALKVAPKVVKTVNKVDNAVNPVRNAINSAIQTGSNWFLNQLRIKR